MSEYERLVMTRSGSSNFVMATSYAAAVVNADARTDPYLDLDGFNHLDVTVEVTGAGTMSAIYLGIRSTAKADPDVESDGDWSRMNRVSNADTATGEDSSVPLVEKIAVAGTGRHTVSLPVTNRFVSAVVWADTADGTGRVYMYRARR